MPCPQLFYCNQILVHYVDHLYNACGELNPWCNSGFICGRFYMAWWHIKTVWIFLQSCLKIYSDMRYYIDVKTNRLIATCRLLVFQYLNLWFLHSKNLILIEKFVISTQGLITLITFTWKTVLFKVNLKLMFISKMNHWMNYWTRFQLFNVSGQECTIISSYKLFKLNTVVKWFVITYFQTTHVIQYSFRRRLVPTS